MDVDPGTMLMRAATDFWRCCSLSVEAQEERSHIIAAHWKVLKPLSRNDREDAINAILPPRLRLREDEQIELRGIAAGWRDEDGSGAPWLAINPATGEMREGEGSGQ